MKKKKLLLFILLCLIPSVVFASSGLDTIPLGMALGMEAFVSIHMTIFVLWPLSNIFGGDNQKALLKKLFIWRVSILLFFDFFITPLIAFVDFLAVFIGVFFVVPISAAIKKTNPYGGSTKTTFTAPRRTVTTTTKKVDGIVLKCAKCNKEVTVNIKFCPACGLPMTGNNIKVESSPIASVQVPPKAAVLPSHFDSMYNLSEDKMLEEFLNREMSKAAIDKNSKLIPSDILKRRKVLNIIFIILLFIYVSMIFFHFPLATYAIGAILLFIFYKVTRRYNLMKYLVKEVKSRPSEKISNIVMTVKSTFVQDDSKGTFLVGLGISIIVPLIIFWNPRILYEKVDNGYAVRFYTFGVTNFKTATIPATYKGEDVTVLRGNTFSNMPFLEEVSLPDTIVEIRGQAFKNNAKLTKVNIPKNLEYLGGGAFYNCSSIAYIELPDTLTYLGGEAFYGASSLRSVKLSNKLTEIRGSTFEECTSLESIEIPDSVTRIGGHAFYGNSSLNEVIFTENSKLNEIGSSAFRRCDSLYEITLPSDVYINERSFKESPTTIHYFNSKEPVKNVITIYNDGTSEYINTTNYGSIGLKITDAKVENGYLQLTLHLSGGINTSIRLVCNGSTQYIYDDFYIETNRYEYKPITTTFNFYYY